MSLRGTGPFDARGWSENARNQTRGADFVRVPRLSVRRAHVLWLGCGEGVALLVFFVPRGEAGAPWFTECGQLR